MLLNLKDYAFHSLIFFKYFKQFGNNYSKEQWEIMHYTLYCGDTGLCV